MALGAPGSVKRDGGERERERERVQHLGVYAMNESQGSKLASRINPNDSWGQVRDQFRLARIRTLDPGMCP